MSQPVYVGLSGGVDSAVSAALLKRSGIAVVGVFIKIWRPEFIECTWREDRLDAMRVCAHLGIPFREIDLSETYRARVIELMLSEFAAGRTPNPDVACNSFVKFGAFLEWALAKGASEVATGHYARIREDEDGRALLRGIDPSKDQSYFLYQLTQVQLEHIRFPIGEFKKSEVRALARQFALPVADKPDSQGLCFVGDVALPDFLRRFLTLHPGPVIDKTGKQIGEHDGAALYTKGERRGFRILDGSLSTKTHYVVSTNIDRNEIVVSEHKQDAAVSHIPFADVHWVHGAPHPSQKVQIETRLRARPLQATIEIVGDHCVAHTVEGKTIAAAGQSLVVYEGDECLGGGTIA